jgi:hypothetical protein
MSSFTQPEYRSLTAGERTLLDWLIANGNPEAQRYASQVPEISVVGRCTCGCPTLDLALSGSTERTAGPSEILADFDGTTEEGVPVGVVLHARKGQISELEVYAISDFEGTFGLPKIQSLKKS